MFFNLKRILDRLLQAPDFRRRNIFLHYVQRLPHNIFIISVEPGLDQVFFLSDRDTHTYRCLYCEARAELNKK